MSDPHSPAVPPPVIRAEALRRLRPGIHVIEDRGVPLVPNIGIIEGRDMVLVVDAGLGPANGATVLEVAERIADGRRLLLTTTHFHPEHAFGAQVFRGKAQFLLNAAQQTELSTRGPAYLGMFQGFGADVAAALAGTEITLADTVYDGARHELDLGGRRVELHNWGLAHTMGDQIIWLPDDGILFTGDLAEAGIFPIFPWFPPDDALLDAGRWRQALLEMLALAPQTVVPGHGAVGERHILQAVIDYMEEVSGHVVRARQAGVAGVDLVERLAPVIRAAHPDWQSPEWIDFAIRYFADTQ